MNKKSMEQLYTVKQAAEKFGMSQAFYRKIILHNQIRYQKIGKAVRLTEGAIKEYFDKYTDTVEVVNHEK